MTQSCLHYKIAGQYRMVLNEETDNPTDTGWFDNMVLDQGLDQIGSLGAADLIRQVCVGTGNTAVTASQTALVAYVANVNPTPTATMTNLGSPTYASQADAHFAFAQGAVIGNMAEVGIGQSTGNGTGLFSRALIVDGSGVPTTLTCTTIDQLTVYYRLTTTPVLTDATGTVTISGTSYAWTGRIALCDSFQFDPSHSGSLGSPVLAGVYGSTATLGPITGVPLVAGELVTNGTITDVTYVNGNFYRDSSFLIAAADGVVSGGIGAMLINFNLSASVFYQYVFSPAIPKISTTTLSMSFRTSWSR